MLDLDPLRKSNLFSEAVRLRALAHSGNTVAALHLVLRLLMIVILCQLVGIWQPARLSQISMQRLLQAGSSAEAISLLETSMEEPAKGQTAGPLTKREVSHEQVGAVLAVCAVPVLTQHSQLGRAVGDARVGAHWQQPPSQKAEVSRAPLTQMPHHCGGPA